MCNERGSEVGQNKAFDCQKINAGYKGKQEFGDTKKEQRENEEG